MALWKITTFTFYFQISCRKKRMSLWKMLQILWVLISCHLPNLAWCHCFKSSKQYYNVLTYSCSDIFWPLALRLRTYLSILDRSSSGTLKPHFPIELCTSLLGRVESTQMSLLSLNMFIKLLESFHRQKLKYLEISNWGLKLKLGFGLDQPLTWI